MAEQKHIHPEEYADLPAVLRTAVEAGDHRVSYLVQEWKRLSQAEHYANELIEADPNMRALAEKELEEIAEQKDLLMVHIEKIVGSPEDREWPNEVVI